MVTARTRIPPPSLGPPPSRTDPSATSAASGETAPLRGRGSRYALALLAVAVATGLSWLIWGAIKPQVSPLFFLAIVLAAWHGGLRPGLLATCLSGFVSIYVFSEPVFSLHVDAADFLRVGVFLAVAVAVSALADGRRRAEEALRAAHAGLERRVAERTAELAQVNEALKQEVSVRRSAEQKLVEHQSHLQDLAAEVVLAEQRERRRIAERLHDDLGQLLALAQIRIGAFGHAADPARPVEELAAIESIVEEAISRTRSITCELSPPVLHELGLGAALHWLVEQFRKQSGLPVTLHCGREACDLSEEAKITLFQIARELLANAAKHALAKSVTLLLSCHDGHASLVVHDDGVGFGAEAADHPASQNAFGLFSIRERLRRHGGTLQILSEPGGGAQVIASLPLDAGRGGVR